MPINVPQPQNNDSALFSIIGAVGGGLATQSLQGASAGANIGQAAGSIVSPNNQTASVGAGNQSEAMARRSQADAANSLQALRQAELALPALPEAQRQEYAPTIIQARMMAEQRMAYA